MTSQVSSDLLTIVQGGGTALALAVMGWMIKYFVGNSQKLQDQIFKQVSDCANATAKQASDYIARLESRDKEHSEDREAMTLALHDLREAVLRNQPRNENSNPNIMLPSRG